MKIGHLSRIFYSIIAAQFCGTSLWFASNAALPQLQVLYYWQPSAVGYLTSSTQLGFILGTLAFAVSGIADRHSPSRIFFISSCLASTGNLMTIIDMSSFPLVLISRFLVGFFLAGIYPVGMKIAADWRSEGLGHWLGALVGALTLGTAFPYGLKLIPQFIRPQYLLLGTSLLSILGATLLLLLVGDGPYRKRGSVFSFRAVREIFTIQSFRSPSFGYFGHMWELYAFWAFVPWIVSHYTANHAVQWNSSLLSFFIIGSGALGCVLGGSWSLRIGSIRVASYALVSSGLCCLLSPLVWNFPPWLFVIFMLFWGVTVVADSPQFSALVARNAPDHLRGSAITLVTCIGFSITIISIQLLNYLHEIITEKYLFLVLLPGPLAGLIFLGKSFAKRLKYSGGVT